jgi:general secretion pathway protein E
MVERVKTEQDTHGARMDTTSRYLSQQSLEEVLVATKLLTKEQMQKVLQIACEEGKTIPQILIENKLLATHDLVRVLSVQLKVPLIDLRRHQVSPEALRLVPEKLARKYNVLPLDIIGSSLVLVMEDPMNIHALDEIAFVSKMRIEPMMAVPEEIREAMDRNYTGVDQVREEFVASAPPAVEVEKFVSDEAQMPALRNLVMLIQQAVHSRATDIHIEPQKDKLQVRYRIDGILEDTMSLDLSIHPPLIAKLKIMAGMNIAEQRRPQDGRCSVNIGGKELDIRVACANTIYGEMAVLRLLSQSISLLELSELGFLPSTLLKYQQMLKLPFGMILLGGPTGSGKTTTLYASVNQLNRMERNIMTIEDPVEYHCEGINQFQVNPKADINFANSIRSFIRLDPDVILVGEIRDSETAKVATQAALTGHLVFSSIHASDAIGIMLRLLDLGVERFFICSSLVGTVAQRIVRRICPHCRVPYEPPVEERLAYHEEMGELPAQFYKGSGCNLCSGIGYLGQCGLFEVFAPTDEVKELFLKGASVSEIRAQASKDGLVPLRHDGMLKVKEGVTTVSEVLRSVFSIY